jgi:hypothetical protein
MLKKLYLLLQPGTWCSVQHDATCRGDWQFLNTICCICVSGYRFWPKCSRAMRDFDSLIPTDCLYKDLNKERWDQWSMINCISVLICWTNSYNKLNVNSVCCTYVPIHVLGFTVTVNKCFVTEIQKYLWTVFICEIKFGIMSCCNNSIY